MIKLLLLTFLALPFLTCAQKPGTSTKLPGANNPKASPIDYDRIFDSSEVEIQPTFGSEIFWKRFLNDSLRTDFLSQKNAPNGKYTVIVSFVVYKNGGPLGEVKALNDPGYGTADEAVRFFKAVKGWNCGILNGRHVSSRTKKAITFEVVE